MECIKKQSMVKDTIIATRLKQALSERGMSAAELSRVAEVNTSFIYDVLSGKSLNPSTITLAKVANVLGVSLPYLVGAEEGQALSGQSFAAKDMLAISSLSIRVSKAGEMMVTEKPAADPRYFFHREWLEKRLKTSPKHVRQVELQGDGMQPTLSEGDVALVDTSKTIPSPPGVFIVFDGYALVAKRLEMLPHSSPPMLRIIADNPKYTPYERPLADTHIIGRVVWFAREV